MLNSFPKPSEYLLNQIKRADNAIIIGHKNPDGDALSSSISLKKILQQMGKDAIILNDGPFLRKELLFMKKEISSSIPSSFKKDNTVVIIVDCSTSDRPGESFKLVKDYPSIVVIDHHSSGTPFVDENSMFLVPASPSTTILVDIVREELNVPLTKEMAYYLYIGLLTDTGFFHFIGKNVAVEVFTRVTEFVKTGLDPYEIYDQMNDGKDFDEIKEICSIIEGAKCLYNGRLILATQEERNERKRLSDVVYQELLKIENVEVVVFFKPQFNETEIGFRAKRNANIDVGKIASDLGGGGHKYASGVTINEPLEKSKEIILELFSSIFK